MAVPLQVPRFHAPIFLIRGSSLCKTPFNLLLKPLKLGTIKSTFTTTSVVTEDLVVTEGDTQVQVSLEKLFFPPETEVPSGSVISSLTTRILKGSNIVLSKYARDAQIVQAEFVKSSVRTEDCPSDGLPEFALVGRSNVGKSSPSPAKLYLKRISFPL